MTVDERSESLYPIKGDLHLQSGQSQLFLSNIRIVPRRFLPWPRMIQTAGSGIRLQRSHQNPLITLPPSLVTFKLTSSHTGRLMNLPTSLVSPNFYRLCRPKLRGLIHHRHNHAASLHTMYILKRLSFPTCHVWCPQ
jgi:hypothetical protein